MAEEVKKEVKISATASRMQASRKRGPKGRLQRQLTPQEEFIKAKDVLLAALQNKDVNPVVLKGIIEHQRQTSNAKALDKEAKLWVEILIRKGRARREAIKAGKKARAVFHDIALYEFDNGNEWEVPDGFTLTPTVIDAQNFVTPIIKHREDIYRMKKV